MPLTIFRDRLVQIDRDLVFTAWRECQPKILIVTDGLNFTAGDGFGLTVFANTLATMTLHGMTPQVIKASRSGAAPGADIANFTFDHATHGVLKSRYDVVFILGVNRETAVTLSAGEIAALGRFMQAGGGVFATGDHEDLGAAMGRDIPRVRNMRFWKRSETPNVSNTKRLSTNLSGTDETEEFADQSDRFPQRLYLNFRTNAGGLGQPHPLVQMPPPGRAIEIFPDHPHEGECRVPASLATTFALDGVNVAEWPAATAGGAVAPEVVAMTMSHGDGFPNGPTGPKQPLEPRAFISICAYDGQRANVGRVATDATWHHFININLDGTGSGLPAAVNGLTAADLNRVQQYYRNLATWLMPRTTRRCLRFPLVFEELRRFPLFEELDLPRPPEWKGPMLRDVGATLAAALRRRLPRWEVDALMADALEDATGERAEALLGAAERIGRSTGQDLAFAALGGLVGGIAVALEDAKDVKEIRPHGALEKATTEAARSAVKLLLVEQRKELQSLDSLLKDLS